YGRSLCCRSCSPPASASSWSRVSSSDSLKGRARPSSTPRPTHGIGRRSAASPALCAFIGGAVLFIVPILLAPLAAVIVISIGYGIGAVVLPLANAAISEICPPVQAAGTLGGCLARRAAGGRTGPRWQAASARRGAT